MVASAALLMGLAGCGLGGGAESDAQPSPAWPSEGTPAASPPWTLAPTATSSAKPNPFRMRPGPILAAPKPDPRDNRAVGRLRRAIRHTPPGARIRIVGFSLSLGDVSTPLIDAAERGVRVQLVLDGHSREFQATQALAEALGEDRTQPSYVVLTKRSARGRAGHLHQKTWMFSQTGRSRRVVMVGSMNLTQFGTTVQYSDTYVFVDRPRIWRVFNDVFDEQSLDRPSKRQPWTARMGAVRAWFNPGYSLEDDPVQRTLERISPSGAQVRIGAYAWYDPRGAALADRVARLVSGGAEVRVLTGLYVSDPIKQRLAGMGVPVFRGVFRGGQNVHFKMLLVHDRERRQRFVLTGSDNWSDSSFRKDDLDIRIPLTAGEYRQYVAFYESIVARGLAE